MIPDVQTRLPEIKLPLTRVGVNNVRKLIKIPRKAKRPIILLVNLNCFVDLPSSQKGTHMSRNLEAINEILEDITKKPVYELEGLCEDIVREITKRHEYATRCEVAMESRLMMMRRTPSGQKTQEFVKLLANASSCKGVEPEIAKEVGVEIKGVIAHPPNSTQKATATLIIEVPEGYFIKIEDLVAVLEDSLSAKAYGFLTEKEERQVITKAHHRHRSVEAVVEDTLRGVANKFNLPSETKITARCVAEESLFTYNSLAERVETFGKLRKEITLPRSRAAQRQ